MMSTNLEIVTYLVTQCPEKGVLKKDVQQNCTGQQYPAHHLHFVFVRWILLLSALTPWISTLTYGDKGPRLIGRRWCPEMICT